MSFCVEEILSSTEESCFIRVDVFEKSSSRPGRQLQGNIIRIIFSFLLLFLLLLQFLLLSPKSLLSFSFLFELFLNLRHWIEKPQNSGFLQVCLFNIVIALQDLSLHIVIVGFIRY